jgi:hypothetical protein
MNTNNVIDFASRKLISTPKAEPESEDLLAITYSNVDEAFEHFLHHMSEELGYNEVMEDNEDLEIAMGYCLTIARSSYAMACNLEDAMSPHVLDIISSIQDVEDADD